jgi:hypothetical protein
LDTNERRKTLRTNTIYLNLLGLAGFLIVAVMSAGLVVSAQNTNSSMTMAQQPKPVRSGRCDPMQQEQTDLSGTYVGNVKHGDQAPMDATLTITGNNFTMTMGSETHSGRITAVTTCGYTAVTIMHGDGGTSAPGTTTPPNKVVSLRAKKVGDSLTLMSVPGEPEKVMFTSGGGVRRPRRQRPRRPATSPATPSPTPGLQ